MIKELEAFATIPREEARKQFEDITKQLDLKHTFTFDEVYDMCLAEREKKLKFINRAHEFQQYLIENGALGEDPFPLKHEFADGMYIRTVFIPAGALTVTKIHGKKHPFFLQQGSVVILTENGEQELNAPHSGITQPGTKRIIWHPTDVVFTTVHKTDKTDIKEIEREIIIDDGGLSEIEQNIINKFIEDMKQGGVS